MFYPQDFLTGTMFMSDEEVGIYIRLLCAQHQIGGLIKKKDFENRVHGNEKVSEKFIETEDGYFNQRLMIEIEKRSKKSDNLSANAKIRWEKEKQKQCKSNAIALDLHMPIENENETVIRNKKSVFVIPEIQEIIEYCKERNNGVDAERFFDFYESKGWVIGKNKMKDWKATVRTWEKNKSDQKQAQLVRREVNPREYNPNDYKVVDYGK